MPLWHNLGKLGRRLAWQHAAQAYPLGSNSVTMCDRIGDTRSSAGIMANSRLVGDLQMECGSHEDRLKSRFSPNAGKVFRGYA